MNETQEDAAGLTDEQLHDATERLVYGMESIQDARDTIAAVEARAKREERERLRELLVRCDSILSLIRHREAAGLTTQTQLDLGEIADAVRIETDRQGSDQ